MNWYDMIWVYCSIITNQLQTKKSVLLMKRDGNNRLLVWICNQFKLNGAKM